MARVSRDRPVGLALDVTRHVHEANMHEHGKNASPQTSYDITQSHEAQHDHNANVA